MPHLHVVPYKRERHEPTYLDLLARHAARVLRELGFQPRSARNSDGDIWSSA